MAHRLFLSLSLFCSTVLYILKEKRGALFGASRALAIFLCINYVLLAPFSVVLAMGSSNFSVDWDSMNSGGVDSASSTNYQSKDTTGEQGTGLAGSTNFQVDGGYRAASSTTSSNGGGGGSGGGSGSGGGGGGGVVISAPVISNIQVINITSGSAQVTWDTDKLSDSAVSFGLNSSHASGTISSGVFTTSHDITLSGLSPNTVYYFVVASTDGTPLTTVSIEDKFQTLVLPDTAAPVISNIQISSITQTSAVVTWDTDELGTSIVAYGTSAFYTNQASTLGSSVGHSVSLAGLSASTTYHVQVVSTDGAGNMATGPDVVFATLPDVVPPTNVSNLQAVAGDTAVGLSWVLPTDPDLAGVYVVRNPAGYPVNVQDGLLIYTGGATSFTDSGLINGTTYYYGVYAFDTSGNIASGSLTNATPQGVTPLPPATTSTPPVVVLPPSPPIIPPSGGATGTTQNPSVPSGASGSSATNTGSGSLEEDSGSTTTLPSVPGEVSEGGSATSTIQIAVSYFTKNNSLQLIPDAQGAFGLLAGVSMVVVATPDLTQGLPLTVVVDVGGSLYSLQPSPGGETYSATFLVPPPGTYPVIVRAVYANGTNAAQQHVLVSQASGLVVEQGITGPSTIAVPQASVQLFQNVLGTWIPYGTVQTAADGSFAYVVPNGEYYAEIKKDGYRDVTTTPHAVTKNVFNDVAAIVRLPIEMVIPPDAPLTEQVQIVAQNVLQDVTYGTKVVREALEDPRVQTANAVVAPALLAAAVANTATAASVFNAFAYLQLLFTQPLLLLGRGKKRKWGVIFNSLSKQPIDLAIVRLIDTVTGFVVQTKVTDNLGRYAFVVKQGSYRLEVTKPGYVFPTVHLQGKTEDTAYAELYQSSVPIVITETTIVAMNIPLDPVVVTETPRRVLWRRSLMVVRSGLAFAAIPLSVFAFIVTPGAGSAVLCVFQVATYALFRRLARPRRAERWGMVMDAQRKPVAQAVVRVFDAKFNKLLETQVTDRNGKYGFFVRRNVYYITAEKAGYEKYVSGEIDLQNQDGVLIDQNISLKVMV